jgi:fructose-1,6-bisphosphatase
MTNTTTKTAIYQIGVDILGFPMYLEHNITRKETRSINTGEVLQSEAKTIEKIVKQH